MVQMGRPPARMNPYRGLPSDLWTRLAPWPVVISGRRADFVRYDGAFIRLCGDMFDIRRALNLRGRRSG